MKFKSISVATLVLFAFLISTCKPVPEQEEKKEINISEHVNQDYSPKRINKCIELFQDGQAVYYKGAYGGYEEGKKMASTWADYIIYNMEHKPLDFTKLKEFMTALVDHGPTPSGHRTPAVIVTMPLLGLDGPTVKANGWMIEQALACGAHGIHLARSRNPEAVREYIKAARYPVHKQAIDELGVGLRGWGSHKFAAWVWGIDEIEYLKKADVWPLNPNGELIMGAKIEDIEALAHAHKTLTVPGLAFAEHGPRDHGFSHGHLDGRADPPMPPEIDAAGQKVLDLCNENELYFLDNVLPDNVEGKLDWGVMIGAGSNEEAANVGRIYTKREMPWY